MIAFIVIGLAGLLSATIGPVVSVGMAYKAKTLCSELFVSGRPQSDILIDLAVDDLRPLRLVRAKVDTGQRDVVARFLLAKRKARFTDEFGCTLAPWPYTGADGPQALASGVRSAPGSWVPRTACLRAPPTAAYEWAQVVKGGEASSGHLTVTSRRFVNRWDVAAIRNTRSRSASGTTCQPIGSCAARQTTLARTCGRPYGCWIPGRA
jgi:hypothetical protein